MKIAGTDNNNLYVRMGNNNSRNELLFTLETMANNIYSDVFAIQEPKEEHIVFRKRVLFDLNNSKPACIELDVITFYDEVHSFEMYQYEKGLWKIPNFQSLNSKNGHSIYAAVEITDRIVEQKKKDIEERNKIKHFYTKYNELLLDFEGQDHLDNLKCLATASAYLGLGEDLKKTKFNPNDFIKKTTDTGYPLMLDMDKVLGGNCRIKVGHSDYHNVDRLWKTCPYTFQETRGREIESLIDVAQNYKVDNEFGRLVHLN